MTLKEYKEKLNKHDWYYAMSDDPRIYDTGLAEENELKRLAENKPSFMKAFKNKEDSLFNKLKQKAS